MCVLCSVVFVFVGCRVVSFLSKRERHQRTPLTPIETRALFRVLGLVARVSVRERVKRGECAELDQDSLCKFAAELWCMSWRGV